MSETDTVRGEGRRKVAMQYPSWNIDNGAGVTIGNILLCHSQPIRILSAYVLYETATGTVAAGNARLGTTVGGSEIAGATAYTNSAAAGSKTAMALTALAEKVPANTPIFALHTGVAATAVGTAHCVIEYHELT